MRISKVAPRRAATLNWKFSNEQQRGASNEKIKKLQKDQAATSQAAACRSQLGKIQAQPFEDEVSETVPRAGQRGD